MGVSVCVPQDKQALEQQQLSNRLQISALQSKLDETRHRYHDNQPDPTQQLRDMLDTTQQDLQDRERQVCVFWLKRFSSAVHWPDNL